MTEPLPPVERRHAALERSRSGPRRLREICRDLSETDAGRKPGVGKLSVIEHVRHMLGMEQKVFAPRLARVLRDEDPTLAPVEGDPYTEPDSSQPRALMVLVEAFEDQRSESLRLVERANDDDWERPYTLGGHGRDDFAGLVERWSRHDDDHLRQIEIIVRNCEERNLWKIPDLAHRALLGVAALPLLAATALAEPGIERVDWEIQKSRKLLVTVAANVDEKAQVVLEGQVNGKPFSFRKRLKKAGARSVKFKIDARKFKLRKLTEEIAFSGLTATVTEKSGAEVERAVDDVSIPVPVVVVRGLGNENSPGALNAFAAAFNAGAGGVYTTEGRKPTLLIHEYPSLTQPLGKLGKSLGKRVKKMLRGSSFAKVDIVGYSMGGLVARSWIADSGGDGRVRRCVFAATPNEGTPVAYIGVGLIESDLLGGLTGLDEFGLGGLDLDALIASAADEDTREAARLLFPTYTWAFTPGLGGVSPASTFLLTAVLGDPTAPLEPLNSEPPDPTVEAWHALAYTSIPIAGLGTVDEVTLDPSLLLGGGLEDLDLASFAQGSGDGLVPARSTFMADVPAWSAVLTTHDMGTGTHLTMLADPAVIARIVELITQ